MICNAAGCEDSCNYSGVAYPWPYDTRGSMNAAAGRMGLGREERGGWKTTEDVTPVYSPVGGE